MVEMPQHDNYVLKVPCLYFIIYSNLNKICILGRTNQRKVKTQGSFIISSYFISGAVTRRTRSNSAAFCHLPYALHVIGSF